MRMGGVMSERISGIGKRMEEWCLTRQGGGLSRALGDPQGRGLSCSGSPKRLWP